ncbi:putative Tyrosyl-tRNA synthetase [Paratrimastix pyriformis]|uniref:Tyrosyl-tRNA synthetase n=1 Tax=Paratrimastix pyriformis TaxID=342808 RepID=A0ABQ8UPR6_9EUKA|nr:putative Tyrosyl-tRNA synthetase [Paratrimastix pyriformis]
MAQPLTVLAQHAFNPPDLLSQYPPRVSHPYKEWLFERALRTPPYHLGEIKITKYLAGLLPPNLPPPLPVEIREDVFDYECPSPTSTPWYLNFADSSLFCAYGSGLFAQDEMQVAEHPLLASVREAMRALSQRDQAFSATTRNRDGAPTPVLISGVQRRVVVHTNPDADQGRPGGLYGNAFTRAPLPVVKRACEFLEHPTTTNLICIEAPSGGWGLYKEEEIRDILRTAYTGFAGARHETPPGVQVVVHTGNWGTGAYGGNKVLMALLQILAARMAGVDKIVGHTFAAMFTCAWEEALREAATFEAGLTPDEIVARVAAKHYRWGQSDGN